MGFFDFIEDAIEEHREREWREELYEEQEEAWEWGMEGEFYDPYRHGDLFFDPSVRQHGVMYNGMWHPLAYDNGAWVFVHPRRYGLPRNYRPHHLTPPQSSYGGGYAPPPQPDYSRQPISGYQAGYSQQPPVTQPASEYQPAGRPQAAMSPVYCTACGAVLAGGGPICAVCGRRQV
jgi:hypothetical protein